MHWARTDGKTAPKPSWQRHHPPISLTHSLPLPTAPVCRLYAAAWRRHTPVLRVVLLFYIYSLPILTSIDAMHAISPAPSKVSQQPLLAAAKGTTNVAGSAGAARVHPLLLHA